MVTCLRVLMRIVSWIAGMTVRGTVMRGRWAVKTVKDRGARRIWGREVRGGLVPRYLKNQGQIPVFMVLTNCRL